MRLTVLFAACLAFASCGDIGQPPTVATTEPLPLACTQIHPDMVAANFVTDSYMTTWGSAYSEGARAGVDEGFAGTGYEILGQQVQAGTFTLGGDRLVRTATSPTPFCMIIAAPTERVRPAIRQALSGLRSFGYGAGEQAFVYDQTGYLRSAHQSARWIDRYTVRPEPLPGGRTIVYVLREVFISRQGSDYYQGFSVGHNEAWLLANIRDRL